MKYIFTLLSILLTHGLFAQSFVEYHPFLHWKATAQDGLMYSNISIEPVNGKKHLLSNQISPMQTLVIKAFQPTGFQESDGLVYFGMGVKVIDGKTGQKSFEIADIYKNQEGADPAKLQSLSLKFTPDEGTQVGSSMTVFITFFDKKGTGKIVIELPLIITESTDAADKLVASANFTNFPSYQSFGQNLQAKQTKILRNNTAINSLDLGKKDILKFQADLKAFKDKPNKVTAVIHQQDGTTIMTDNSELPANWDGTYNFKLPKNTAIGAYLFSISIESPTGKQGFSEWFFLRDGDTPASEEKIDFGSLLYLKAYQQHAQKHYKETLLRLENTLLYHPESIDALFLKGDAANQLKRYPVAQEAFKKVTIADSKNFDAWFGLATAFREMRDYDNALAGYRICTKLKPEHYFSHYYAGWVYNELERFEDALPYLNTAIELNLTSLKKPYFERIRANKKLKNFDAVIQDFQTLAEVDPANPDFPYQIGYYLIEQKKYEEAVTALTQSIEIDLYSYAPVFERAYAYKYLGKYELAIADFQKAIELGNGKEPAQVYLLLGDCQMALKQRVEACANYQKAADKNVKGAKKKLADLCGKE